MVEIGESIDVVVSFRQGRIRPLRFRWRHRLISVKSITYQWKRQDGLRCFYHFSVTDGSALYNLCFDPNALCWRLHGVETG